MPGVTAAGTPYAVGTDQLRDTWPETSWQVAQRVDQVDAARVKTAAGKKTHTTVNGWNSFAVTFPAGLFTTAPVVVVSCTKSPQVGAPDVGPANVTATGATIHAYNTAAVTIEVTWIAQEAS